MRKNIVDNPRYPHHIHIVRKVFNDWLTDENGEYDEVVVYDGPGRSYTDTTTTGDSRVDINKRKASIPMRFDKWQQVSTGTQQSANLIPMSGDMLYVTKGDISEEWEVKDFEPDNDRSVIYGQMNRSLNS